MLALVVCYSNVCDIAHAYIVIGHMAVCKVGGKQLLSLCLSCSMSEVEWVFKYVSISCILAFISIL